MDQYESGAAKILANIEAMYVANHDYQEVNASEFQHLNLAFYDSVRAELQAEGYLHLADVEDRTITSAPGGIFKRIMIRSMLSPDRTIMASAYDPRIKFGWWLVLSILRKAPAPALDLETELSDGSFIVTSNAESAAAMTSPPFVLSEFFEKKTPASALLRRHSERIQAYMAVTGAKPKTVANHDQLIAAQNRMNAIKSAHRNELGGISAKELERLSPRWSDTSKRVHEKIVELRSRTA
jgi:hypothetical protein